MPKINLASPLVTPAFIVDRQKIQKSYETLAYLRRESGCRVLYSIKALPLRPILEWLQPHVDGFSVSSLFEAKLAREVLAKEQSVHLTTPGIKAAEVAELTQLCSHVSCNSLTQQQHFLNASPHSVAVGLRINPKLSFAQDARFDPCRIHSKLGVDINTIDAKSLQGVSGLHVHTVFSEQNYAPLLQTVALLKQKLGQHFSQLHWLNLGGGYLIKQMSDHQVFIELVKTLRRQYGLEVYIEPGKAVVGDAVTLQATVIDSFSSDGKVIAVLDTSINHNPEVFEYQRQPDIKESTKSGKFGVILVGATCLAGDVFGEYHFDQAVKVGDSINFTNVGAYTLVKANRFNGYNFPDIYSLAKGKLTLLKHYDYESYRQFWV
ncbi:MAG: carboxynorspermidine decarboxylase [Methyloprofundus sp.]|nr:carboxynorspermidine decarboxylase [Methyloprofundus sp.]